MTRSLLKTLVALGLVLTVVVLLIGSAAVAAPPGKIAPSGSIASLNVTTSHATQGGTASVSISFAGVSDHPNNVQVTVRGPGGNGSNKTNGTTGFADSVVVNISIPADANAGAWAVTEVTILAFDGNLYNPTNLSITTFPAGSVIGFTVDPPAPADTIPPVITASATKADGTTYVAGTWTNQDVTVHYSATDAGGSGLASVTADQTFTATTVSTTGTATDNAGNSASVSFGPINIDKIPPTVIITGPALVWQGSAATATWSASDTGGSGLAGAAAGTLTLNTTAAGTYTVTTTASDNAGNSTIASFTYTVWGVNGPFAPVIKNGLGVGQFKAGSTIPVKFQLTDGTRLIATAQGTVAIGGAGAAIRWDATAQQYIANVKTGAAGTNIPVVLTVNGVSGSYTLATVTLTSK